MTQLSLRGRTEYRRLRADGHVARFAYHAATINQRWRAAQEAGLVELAIEPDEWISFEDLTGDTYNREANPDIPEARMAREEAAERERIDREGVWGIVGRYRVSPDALWKVADSICGFIGNDFEGSGYDVDVKSETLDRLTDALRGRCPRCRKAA